MKRMVSFIATSVVLHAFALPPSRGCSIGRVERGVVMKQRRVGADNGYTL